MFKIKSKFYVIYGDGVPIYVGFTSRKVCERFSEHKKSKDFSDYDEIKVEELKNDELDFDFTWDYNVVESEANKVSQREAELVKKFGTQNSEFQKANGGGTVWTHIKYFVLSNKDNPKYRGMSGNEIHEYLENRKKEMRILGNFIGHINYPSKIILNHFIMHIGYPSKIILGNFISNINYPSTGILNTFIHHVDYPSKIILSNFIMHIDRPSKIILCSFVGGIKYPSKIILGSFIARIKYPSKIILSHFIYNINYPSKIILRNFIGNMRIKKEK